jgi:hypothetical protein
LRVVLEVVLGLLPSAQAAEAAVLAALEQLQALLLRQEFLLL